MDVMESPDPAASERRTQRQPLACVSCTRSKVRCDKQVPCARCQKKGVECRREKVSVVSKRGTGAGKYLRPSSVSTDAKPDIAKGKVTKGSPAPKDHKRDVIPGFREYFGVIAQEQQSVPPAQYHNNLYPQPPQGSRPTTTGTFEDIATFVEGLAWGRHQCHSYPHTNCRRVQPSGPPPATNVPPELLALLPSTPVAWQLIRHHIDYLSWYHGVLHTPTFLQQCDRLWTSAEVDHPQWLALYCGVLAAASWSLENSHAPAECSTADLFGLAVDVLYRYNFLERHTIYSIQATCVLEMVAHVQGRSDLFTVLVNSTIRIGQCLGLHHIPNDQPQGWEDRVDKEIGRRVWSKLTELDCHSMPYAGTITLNPRNQSTQQPLNCDDDDLIERPPSTLTNSTCSLMMSKIASLMPALLDGMCNLSDVRLQYQRVIESDREMRSLVATFPPVLLRRLNAKEEPRVCWLTAARRTLAISAADKVIMIHRPFLLKSFESPAFLFTRNTCVSAALTILRLHEELHTTTPGCAIWIHSAFCVTAIVVLCLNILYLSTTSFVSDSATIEKQLVLVQKAKVRLSRQRSDTMASRGCHIVDAMLGEGNVSKESLLRRFNAWGKLDLGLILDRFLALDNYVMAPMGSTEETLGSFETDGLLQEFDLWYASVFGS